MAKIGNFVGQGWLAFGKREAKKIEKHLIALCKQVFGEDYFSYYRVEIDNKPYSYSSTGKRYRNVRSMKLYAYVANPVPYYRNGRDERVKNHTCIIFTIHKDGKGWLEVTDPANPYKFPKERDYDNCPPFSYSGGVRGDGRYMVYRGTQENILEPRHSYQYGTEVSDLDFTDALRDLRSMTRVWKVLAQAA